MPSPLHLEHVTVPCPLHLGQSAIFISESHNWGPPKFERRIKRPLPAFFVNTQELESKRAINKLKTRALGGEPCI